MTRSNEESPRTSPGSWRGRIWACAAGLYLAAPQLALAASGAQADKASDELSLGALIFVVGLFLAIILVPWLLYNTFMVWLTTRVLRLSDQTLETAFRLSVFQFLIPMPVAAGLAVAGYYLIRTNFGTDPASAVSGLGLIGAILGFIAIYWFLCVALTQRIYRLGFLRAAIFNVVLTVVHGAIGFLLNAGDLLSTLAQQMK
jgi:hypothetical protein